MNPYRGQSITKHSFLQGCDSIHQARAVGGPSSDDILAAGFVYLKSTMWKFCDNAQKLTAALSFTY